MIPGQAGGMPPQAPPMGGQDAISKNRSVMNPVDMAAMSTDGTVQPGMKVRDLIEKVFKVSIDAPVEELTAAIKRQGQNKTNMGKMGAMAGPGMGQPPQPPRMPQRRPSAVPQPGPQGKPQGLADLMG